MTGQRVNFVFMQVGDDPRAALFVESVRKVMSTAYIVQCTDPQTAEVPGVDRVFRHDGNVKDLMMFRIDLFSRITLNGPAVYLDSDMLMLRAFDLHKALGKADVGLCERVFGRNNLINPKCEIDASEYEGRTFGQVWPYLGCFAIARSPSFWSRCRDIVDGLPEKFRFWYGDQEALRIISRSPSLKVAKLKESEFACLPHFAKDYPTPYFLHFKGPRQKDNMFVYARSILG
jgi:hypothetical protein